MNDLIFALRWRFWRIVFEIAAREREADARRRAR